ncbi:MAG: hypothetical protein O3A47_01610 [Chloroflexi bacterium]|nr:hypothetical protein [Chloroflexota bacterium]
MKLALGTLHSDKEFVAELRSEFPSVEFRSSASDEEEQANIRDADAFWGNPSRELLQAAERLQWLQSVGTGVENIVSIPEVRESDIVLTNCRGPHAEPMADHVFGMVTTLAHKLNEMWDDQREPPLGDREVQRQTRQSVWEHHGHPCPGRHRKGDRPKSARVWNDRPSRGQVPEALASDRQ